MGSSTRLAFEPSATPLGMYGAPDCCQEKASVALRRCDTLGRPRPFSNPGKLRHVNEQEHTGNLQPDRKSTRLNSSHVRSSYAVFCLKKKTSGRFFCASSFSPPSSS